MNTQPDRQTLLSELAQRARKIAALEEHLAVLEKRIAALEHRLGIGEETTQLRDSLWWKHWGKIE